MYTVDTNRVTDTSNITVGWDSDNGREFYFADIVYDNDEKRCPIACDVDNIISSDDFEEVKAIANNISKQYNIPMRMV